MGYNQHIIRLIESEIGSPLKGCEVGVWTGSLSSSLLAYFSRLHLLMVDRYELFDNGGTRGLSKVKTQDGMLDALCDAFRGTSFAKERRTLLVANSILVASVIEDCSLDFVYIDADHHYESVLADVKAWFPKVKTGGLVSGHDYHSRRRWGVKRAVNEFAKEHEYTIGVVDARPKIWWFKK